MLFPALIKAKFKMVPGDWSIVVPPFSRFASAERAIPNKVVKRDSADDIPSKKMGENRSLPGTACCKVKS